jgi:hypothetical protein
MPRLVPSTGPSVPSTSLKVGKKYDVFYQGVSFTTGDPWTDFEGRGTFRGKGGPDTYIFESFINPDGTPSRDTITRIVTESGLFKEVLSAPKSVGTKRIPAGSDDSITNEDIKHGDTMIDFDNEFSFGRYYHETTYPKLKGKNPFTNKQINTSTVKTYTAQISEGGYRKKKTLRRRTTKRRRTRHVKRA